MRLFQLLFGLSGRVDRDKFWKVIVVSGAIFIVGGLMISAIVAFAFGLHRVSFRAGILGLIFITPLSVRRLHDRDKSGWRLSGFYALPAGLSFIDDAEGMGLPYVFSLASVALSVWGFVELGCLRGTPGPNRFGPDPLAG